MASWSGSKKGYNVLSPQRRSPLMAWSQKRWLDLLAALLIGAVFIIVIGEELFGVFFQKPVGGILTLVTVSILGYFYFSK
jgi:hypothetical protein